MEYKFPKDFFWGGATSGPQSEGASNVDGKSDHIYDHFFKIAPHRFFEGVGPNIASNYYYDYEEYHNLFKSINFNSFRPSIQWSRLIPDGKGKVNEKAVTFYHNIIDSLLEKGIEPFMNLYHFDMPMCMQNIGGFENREVVEHYADYAETCFKLYGDKVKHWFTFNEPIVPVEGGYLYDFMYPNIVDFKKAVQVAYHSSIASARATEIFHSYKKAGQTIGIILNLSPSYPRSNNEYDLKASRIADLFINKSFLDPAILGTYPKELIEILEKHDLMPKTTKEDCAIIKNNTIDFLGINYYQPRRVKARDSMPNPEAPIMPDHFFENYEMPGRKMNPHRGWEIYYKGIYDLLINVKNNYGNIPCFISENGMGVENESRFKVNGRIEDDYRIEFIKGHLKYCHQALEEGVNLKGYHLWSPLDCWSWMNAYKNRYGFVEVDINNNCKKTLKSSAYWFADMVKNQGF